MDEEVPVAAPVPENNLPWVEKYRPKQLDQIISNENIISTITRLIENNKLPNLLLHGPPGTGKTSTILACARKLNGPRFSSMVLELNASDDRGIDVVRELKDFASTRTIFSGGYKLVILDEADMMTKDAQFALRRVIEKYAKNTRFCLICNYVNKIIPALQSRCTRFRFSPLDPTHISNKLREVAVAENVRVTDDGLKALLRLGGGDMRKCLNVMQATSLAFPEVNAENVYTCTGNPLPSDIESIVGILFNSSFQDAVLEITELAAQKGLALSDILTYVHQLILRMELPPKAFGFILSELAKLEYRLSVSTSEKIQLSSLVSIFQLAKDMIGESA
eukprot:TRINITY_DN8321_c0_g2_i1.p1 TRINITY_DN8321_c0_g2~~TRINITY_DN8321_c0_g2_i1.p1  ORF type:complete len:335 (+),score=51.35 TRINITY_DN8321_c0_g2_i1:74-1078(+)